MRRFLQGDQAGLASMMDSSARGEKTLKEFGTSGTVYSAGQLA